MEEIETEIQETDNDRVAFAELLSKDGWDEYQTDKFSVMAISEAFEIMNTASLKEDDLIGQIVKLTTKTEKLFDIAHSGSSRSFLNKKKTARRLQKNYKSTLLKRIPPEDAARNLACYNGETIIPKGRMTLIMKSGGWNIQAAPFIIVDDQKTNITGRNTLPQIGIKLVEEK